ncbi:MAG: ABC transporter permease [Ruminococcus sp.]
MKKILLCCIPLLIIILSFFYFTTNVTSQLPNTTLMNYNLQADKEPLTISDIEKLIGRISDNGIAFCCEYDEIKINEETVSVVLVNENYLDIMNVSKDGIADENAGNKEKVAVISNQLALKLFFTVQAENKDLNIFGKAFKITDVYNNSSDFINEISKDGKERIYIPYTCSENYSNINVESIAFSNNSPSAPLIEQMDLSQYHSVDFSEKSKVIHTFEHMLCFCFFAGFSIIALRIWYFLCRKYFSEIKNNLKENYFLKSINSIPQKYLLTILVGIGTPLVLLVIFSCSDFSVYIASEYIPNDNIFDVSHYLNAIIENANLSNSIALTGDNYLSVLYSNTFEIIIWLFALFVFNFSITTFMILKNLNKPIEE